MKRRQFCLTSLAGIAALNGSKDLLAAVPEANAEGELLYNGIRLPKTWPPVGTNSTLHLPGTPPYLAARPAVVKIDVGRQLFVDDFLIESTTLQRGLHQAQRLPCSPTIPWRRSTCRTCATKKDTPWSRPRATALSRDLS